jgi:predicted HicB family RNase H-like nuclease
MANINIKIPEDVHKQLKIEAIKQDLTLKEYIIRKLSEPQKELKTRKKQ